MGSKFQLPKISGHLVWKELKCIEVTVILVQRQIKKTRGNKEREN
jgi:hypothetical protein